MERGARTLEKRWPPSAYPRAWCMFQEAGYHPFELTPAPA
jgi:hypothetical protein